MAKDEFDRIEWLALCTNRERAHIRRHADVVTVPAGTVLLHEGDGPRWLYAVIDGTVAATVDGDFVGEVGPGELVNELEVLHNATSPVTVTAASDVNVLVMGRREFLGMLDEIPGLARRLLVPYIPKAISPSRRPVLVPLPAA